MYVCVVIIWFVIELGKWWNLQLVIAQWLPSDSWCSSCGVSFEHGGISPCLFHAVFNYLAVVDEDAGLCGFINAIGCDRLSM